MTASPDERYARASLDGLSVGDAFGERFFVSPDMVEYLLTAAGLGPLTVS